MSVEISVECFMVNSSSRSSIRRAKVDEAEWGRTLG
jgi:hypothetical protein